MVVTALVAGAREQSPTSGAVNSSFSASAAAPFRLQDVRDPARVVEFSGTPAKPTVINFFAAWCVPCREELPYFAQEAAARPGIDFVGVDVRDVRSDAVALMDEAGVMFPAGADPRREVARSYGAVGMPMTVFVAPGGRVLASHQGPISQRELRRLLDRLEAA